MTLSVVICSYERPACVRMVLADLASQLPDRAEVVVVDQSGPEAGRSVRRWVEGSGDPRVRLLQLERASLPMARNAGIAATGGEILLFLDDDVRLLPGCLDAHLRAYRDPRIGGVVGRIIERTLKPNAPHPANRVDRAGRVRTNLEGRVAARVEALKGANMSFRRSALRQAGPFDPNYQGTAFLEDADLSERVGRLGWELWFEPDAAVVHLSAPRGGVRTGDPRQTEWWRFRNTGYFMRRHRPASTWPLMASVFGAVAVKRSLQWRSPGAAGELMVALARGWADGGSLPSGAPG